MAITRRQFITRTGMATAGTLLGPRLFENPFVRQAMADTIGNRYLVVLFLDGGNDGLNTVVPYGSGTLRTAYNSYRSNLNLSQSVLSSHTIGTDPATGTQLAFHPGLAKLRQLYNANKVAVIQGCGYPDYSLSHEEARIIWQTANPGGVSSLAGTGWVGRHLAGEYGGNAAPAVCISSRVEPEFRQSGTSVLAIERLADFGFPYDRFDDGDRSAKRAAFQQLYGQAAGNAQPLRSYLGNTGLATLQSSENYPEAHDLWRDERPQSVQDAYDAVDRSTARDLREVSKIIYAQERPGGAVPNVHARFFQVSNGGYDTHSDQGAGQPDGQHYSLHAEVGDSIKAFYDDLSNMGVANRVCIVVWSEFSRRIPQNDNGTDHGSQGPMFVIGGAVNGGVYGRHPNITSLDNDENTVYSQAAGQYRSTDFRDVYGTVLKRWVNMAPASILSNVLPLDGGNPADHLDGGELRHGLPAVALADYYFADPRVVLVPIEHLSARGVSREFGRLVRARGGWSDARLALFDAGFSRYWTRSTALALRTPTWPFPRRRHVAVVRGPLAVRPYVGLLNTSAWMLYDADLDPDASDPELVAYLLAHGDWVAGTGEVTLAAARSAAWWLERTDDECAAFAAAAGRSTRPDAEAWRALAASLPWLRQLHHDVIRPPVLAIPERPIPGTGLLVPRTLEDEPASLAERWASVAQATLGAYRDAWRRTDPTTTAALCDWLASAAPPLLVTASDGAVVWDPEAPRAVDRLRAALAPADGVAVEAILADLRVVERHTRAFFAAVVRPDALPRPPANTFQEGYTYLHAERRLIAYNLHEPGMERLHGPPLPYERQMVGARTAHEWAHLADAAGWVPRTVSGEVYGALRAALAVELDAAIAAAPAAVRRMTAADLAALARPGVSAGVALAQLTTTRMPDWRANLVARAFMTTAERETYVRHNVRTLRGEYAAPHFWRMLIRYLFEYQYVSPALGLTAIADPRDAFLATTGVADDVLASGVLDGACFDTLAAAVGRLCACHAVDAGALRLPGPGDDSEPAPG